MRLQDRDRKSLEAVCPVRCPRRPSSVAMNLSGQTWLWSQHFSRTHLPQDAVEYSTFTCLLTAIGVWTPRLSTRLVRGLAVLLQGLIPAAYLNPGSVMDRTLAAALLSIVTGALDNQLLCSRKCFAESCPGRAWGPLGLSSLLGFII